MEFREWPAMQQSRVLHGREMGAAHLSELEVGK